MEEIINEYTTYRWSWIYWSHVAITLLNAKSIKNKIL